MDCETSDWVLKWVNGFSISTNLKVGLAYVLDVWQESDLENQDKRWTCASHVNRSIIFKIEDSYLSWWMSCTGRDNRAKKLRRLVLRPCLSCNLRSRMGSPLISYCKMVQSQIRGKVVLSIQTCMMRWKTVLSFASVDGRRINSTNGSFPSAIRKEIESIRSM